MFASHLHTWHRRRGLTLTELLVTAALIVTLATLVVAFGPRLVERQRASTGADQLQQWLLVAKQRALRDRRPGGVRLLRSGNAVTTLQYIEMPEEWREGNLSLIVDPVDPNKPTNQFAITNADLTGGFSNSSDWRVQDGDYLQISDSAPLLRIFGSPTGGGTTWQLSTVGTVPSNTQVSPLWRIIRGARPVVGESPLELPKDVIIDCGDYTNTNNPVVRSYPPTMFAPSVSPQWIDILFEPSGAVMGPGRRTGKIILWVRDQAQDPASPGDQTLITVYTRAGFIAAHPVDQTDADNNGAFDNAYSFTQDGRASGL